MVRRSPFDQFHFSEYVTKLSHMNYAQLVEFHDTAKYVLSPEAKAVLDSNLLTKKNDLPPNNQQPIKPTNKRKKPK